jgi:PAS domain S-box-containing protein
MPFQTVILQSAGSLAVAILALLMTILQMLFFIKKPQLTWYGWSAALSFSTLLYSSAIFIEYNTPAGPLNYFSGALEWTAIICLIHSLYGFTFAYLGIRSKGYHLIAGICHGLILILLWSTGLFVAKSFVTRHFSGLSRPYIEAAIGPLGPAFMLYAAVSVLAAMVIWSKHKNADAKNRNIYLTGIAIWFLMGVHDGLAVMGVPSLQYFMEYGFLGFTIATLWVVSNNFLDLSAEEKYRVITEFANDCILVMQNEKLVFANPACEQLIGRSISNWATKDFLHIMPPDDQKRVLRHTLKLLDGSHVPDSYTIRVQNTEREDRFAEIISSVIQYRGHPAVLSVARDITERVLAEKSLRESEEKYRSMMEAMSDSVYICSSDFHIIYMNPAMIKMAGRDATGEVCHEALFNQDKKCWWCLWDEYREEDIYETEMANPKNNRSYHVTHSPIFHENGSVSHMFILKDITLTKQLRQQLLRSERLSVTGQLAATVAHEINSPLQGILSLVNSMERHYAEDEKLSKNLDLIRRGFLRIRDTVRKLLDLNRPGKEEKRSVQVNKIIEDTIGLLNSYTLKNHVEMVLDLSSTLPNTNASPQQLGHVFMNLITNAVEAMAGTLKSDSASQTATTADRRIAIRSGLKDDTITVEVKDTGPGISEEDLEHIFDFFYTRKKEKGMGIGLSICHGIIEDHDGSIMAANAPEGGAVFTVTLPVT